MEIVESRDVPFNLWWFSIKIESIDLIKPPRDSGGPGDKWISGGDSVQGITKLLMGNEKGFHVGGWPFNLIFALIYTQFDLFALSSIDFPLTNQFDLKQLVMWRNSNPHCHQY